MDDLLISVRDLKEMEIKLHKLVDFCTKKNLKLAPSKFELGKEVTFGGTKISAHTLSSTNCIFLEPTDHRVEALQEIARPENKKEVQIFCGLIS